MTAAYFRSKFKWIECLDHVAAWRDTISPFLSYLLYICFPDVWELHDTYLLLQLDCLFCLLGGFIFWIEVILSKFADSQPPPMPHLPQFVKFRSGLAILRSWLDNHDIHTRSTYTLVSEYEVDPKLHLYVNNFSYNQSKSKSSKSPPRWLPQNWRRY
jgi:hypothetical protein